MPASAIMKDKTTASFLMKNKRPMIGNNKKNYSVQDPHFRREKEKTCEDKLPSLSKMFEFNWNDKKTNLRKQLAKFANKSAQKVVKAMDGL